MQMLDVCKRDSGKVFQRKVAAGSDGVLLTIVHSALGNSPLNSRNIRFLHTAFDSSGDRLVAGDYLGNVHVFDFHANRFSLVQRTGSPCSALAFNLHRRNEFLVATADYSLKCFDCDSKELVAMMKGHESIIHAISVHSSGKFAITTSTDTAQLWDLDSFQRKRKLNVKENVGIVKVFFLPMSNTIVTCFKDDSIFAWDSETLECRYQLHSPNPGEKAASFKAFATTRDGRLLVGGGRSRFLHIWSLENQTLLRVVELPRKVTCVHFMDFLPDSFDSGSNQILAVLSQDGIMRFINIVTFSQLFEIGRLDDRISSAAICPNGRYIAVVTENGHINVYSAQALSQELNKPPAPLVKVLKSNRTFESGVSTQELSTKSLKSTSSTGSKTKVRPNGHSAMSDYADGLGTDRLVAILRGYGEYPAKYRMFIWRIILRLPENHAAYAALLEKGTHPSYEKLHENYPIKSHKLLRVLQRVLSALAHWAPIFGETSYLPLLAFPFVKLFQNNQLVCFEIVATILTSWCRHWFEYFPNPPINVLSLVENVLGYHDKELLQHFVKHGVTSQIYAWPLLETFFSEVLTCEEWLKLSDNIFSNHPSFVVMVTVSYCIVGRAALLRCSEFDDFKYFFHHRNAMSVNQVITEAYHLEDSTPDEIHPRNVLEPCVPLTKGQYPIFNKFPKFIVDFQVQERERIRREEEEFLKQKTAALELRVAAERRQQEDAGWYRQQKLLQEAEETRRDLITKEEQKLADQRARVAAMNREMKMKELHLLDATRRKFISFTQQQKQAELARLDDEIRRRVAQRDNETRAAIEEIEIKNMELQLQKRMFEQELYQGHVDLTERQKAELEAQKRQIEIERERGLRERDTERFKELQTRTAQLQKLSRVDHLNDDADYKLEMENLRRLDEIEEEKNQAIISRLEEENKELETGIRLLMKEAETRKAESAKSKYELLAAEYSGKIGPPSKHLQASNANEEMGSEDGDTFISLRRHRTSFDEKEKQMMDNVRRLREKLAHENRNKKPIPPYQLA